MTIIVNTDGLITGRMLHVWYLEAIKEISSTSYNEKANVSYDKLTKEQQFIDIFIANKINAIINKRRN